MTVDTATELRSYIELHNQGLLKAYTAHKSLIREHHGIEQTVMAGGYGYRQILELVQNGADAILEAHESGLAARSRSRVQVLLRGSRLYVANTGAPLSHDGVGALLSSHSSPKRGNQIGRFGLGFKSLLALGGTIDLFTRNSGAIRLDPPRCRRMLRERFEVANAPGLRLAWPLDDRERLDDRELAGLGWAETVVRVGVESEETLRHLRQEIRSFPAEFLLFFPVPVELVLDDGEQPARELGVQPDGERLVLQDGKETSRWLVARREVRVADPKARADATHIHARDSVPVAWAVPVEGRREEAGRFWAFFPTHTPTFMRGILNAPWKLNSDRNAIIGGDRLRRAEDGHGADRAAGLQSGALHADGRPRPARRGERRHGAMSRRDGPGQPGAVPGSSPLPLLQALLRSSGVREGLRHGHGGQRRCGDTVPDDERHPRPRHGARACRPQVSPRSRAPVPPGRCRPARTTGHRAAATSRCRVRPRLLLASTSRLPIHHDAVDQRRFLEREVRPQRRA